MRTRVQPSLATRLAAIAMCVPLVWTPFGMAVATGNNSSNSAIQEGANKGRQTGKAAPDDLPGSYSNGTVTLDGGSGSKTQMQVQDLWGGGSSTPDPKQQRNLYGSDRAKLQQEGRNANNKLKSKDTARGGAYAVTQETESKKEPDFSNSPLGQFTKKARRQIQLQNTFQGCKQKTTLKKVQKKGKIKNIKTCLKGVDNTKQCEIKHDYSAELLSHKTGPANARPCGRGCQYIWIGKKGNNYWSGNLNQCKKRTQVTEWVVENADAIRSIELQKVHADDAVRVYAGVPGESYGPIFERPQDFSLAAAGSAPGGYSFARNSVATSIDAGECSWCPEGDGTTPPDKYLVYWFSELDEAPARLRGGVDVFDPSDEFIWDNRDCDNDGTRMSFNHWWHFVRNEPLPVEVGKGCSQSDGYWKGGEFRWIELISEAPPCKSGNKRASPGIKLNGVVDKLNNGDVLRLKTDTWSSLNGGESWARLKITYKPSATIVNESWHPKPCVQAAQGIDDKVATGGYTCKSLPDHPDAPDGCSYINGIMLCNGDFKQKPLEDVNALCKKVAVDAKYPMAGADGKNLNQCKQYANDPQCGFISRSCDKRGAQSGRCYMWEEKWDCGKTVKWTEHKRQTQYQCGGGIRCMGSECMKPNSTSSGSFEKAATMLQAANFMLMDGNCASSKKNVNVDPSTCRVFKGEALDCANYLSGYNNCCEGEGGGGNISLQEYIQLMQASMWAAQASGAVSYLSSTAGGQALLGAWESVQLYADQIWTEVKSYMSTAYNSIAGNTTASASSAAAQGTANTIVQNLTKSTAQWVGNTFGQAAKKAIFGESAKSIGGQGAWLTNALSTVMTIYTIYVIAKAITDYLTQCDKEAARTYTKKKLKSCHKIGDEYMECYLGVCQRKRHQYCCFNSPLSRILQEQIRQQLGRGWGTVDNPDCGGFKPSVLARVDWSKVDLSEWRAILADTGNLPNPNQLNPEELTGTGHKMDEATSGQRANVVERTKQRISQIKPEQHRREAECELQSNYPSSRQSGSAGCSYGKEGPPDNDRDGVPNKADPWPNDASRKHDTDGDGVADSNDAFPDDAQRHSDSDGDGFADQFEQYPNNPNKVGDLDGDGVSRRNDAFPQDPSEWSDADGDSYGDNEDVFPNDPNEWKDSDGDGYGDNEDEFPDDARCHLDNDDDGHCKALDAFPGDHTEWNDDDRDGYGDNNDDKCPNNPRNWSDQDGDGYCNQTQDWCPAEPDGHKDEDHDGCCDVNDPHVPRFGGDFSNTCNAGN